jgi:ferredoxin
LTVYTGAIKNLYGIIPGGLKKNFHVQYPDKETFSSMLLDLYLAVKPNLNIMDAIIAMEGQGPSAGNPRKLGLIFASSDALALDVAATSTVGLKVPMIEEAKKRKLPYAKHSDIEIVGNKIRVRNFKSPYLIINRIPSFLVKIARYFLTRRPVVDKNKCTGCAKCAEICTRQIIKMVEGYPKIDYSKCIRCYCCHEYCPSKAYKLKQSFILKFFRERNV